MRKRCSILFAVFTLMLITCQAVRAQVVANPNCSTYTPPVSAQPAVCYDTTTKAFYFWNGSAFTVQTFPAGQGQYAHPISGVNQTLAAHSATIPAIDVENHLLTANTIDVLPAAAAVADTEIVIVKFVQAAGNYTAALTAGAGTVMTYTTTCAAPLAIPSGAGSELDYDVHYNVAKTEWAVLGCSTH